MSHDRALEGHPWGDELLEEYAIPMHLREGLTRYLKQHIRPGHFLAAVLSNDLADAMLRGDPASLAGLEGLVRFLTYECPQDSHGSADAVDRWTARAHEERGGRALV